MMNINDKTESWFWLLGCWKGGVQFRCKCMAFTDVVLVMVTSDSFCNPFVNIIYHEASNTKFCIINEVHFIQT